VALLQRLGFPVTTENVRALTGWAAAEGGHFHNDARYNPLNTTQPAPGAGNTGTQGNIKVYRSWDQGLDATVETLRNGRYAPILAALKNGNSAEAVGAAIGKTPWGTNGSLVTRTIGSTPAKPIGSLPTATPAAARAAGAPDLTGTPPPAGSGKRDEWGPLDGLLHPLFATVGRGLLYVALIGGACFLLYAGARRASGATA
jgi:hypothetical protein